jgi:predicted nucleic acid-binding protein
VERPVLTSSHVIGEFATLLGRYVGFEPAADRASELYGSSGIDILQSTRADEIEALNWMKKYADQHIGFTDCLSFALMRRHGIRAAFTFDRHFRDAGFDVVGVK